LDEISRPDPVPRQPGQGGDADTEVRDLRTQLLKAEAAHFAKVKGTTEDQPSPSAAAATTPKRQLEGVSNTGDSEEGDLLAKRRRILEETRDIDADSDGTDSDSSEEDRSVCVTD
jgi:protein CWC15